MGIIYAKQAWKRLRANVLRERPLCQACLALGITRPATDVDHIVAIGKGGDPWDIANLRALCHSCHSQKTRQVDQMGRDSVRVKGCDAQGRPLDEAHWWHDSAKKI